MPNINRDKEREVIKTSDRYKFESVPTEQYTPTSEDCSTEPYDSTVEPFDWTAPIDIEPKQKATTKTESIISKFNKKDSKESTKERIAISSYVQYTAVVYYASNTKTSQVVISNNLDPFNINVKISRYSTDSNADRLHIVDVINSEIEDAIRGLLKTKEVFYCGCCIVWNDLNDTRGAR